VKAMPENAEINIRRPAVAEIGPQPPNMVYSAIHLLSSGYRVFLHVHKAQ
jgi:hypothetical protein